MDTPFGVCMKEIYNTCDILQGLLSGSSPEQLAYRLRESGVSHVYAGSYFCMEYLKSLRDLLSPSGDGSGRDSFRQSLEKMGMAFTLVVPVPEERNLEAVHSIIKETDPPELVVNDYGTLVWAAENLSCPVILGRLFMRQTRDPRIFVYGIDPDEFRPSELPFSERSLAMLQDRYRVRGLELDDCPRLPHMKLPEGFSVGLHTPWTMMSCMRICEDASADLPHEKKFRPGQTCAVNCSGVYRHYYLESGAEVYKIGKGTFYYNDQLEKPDWGNLEAGRSQSLAENPEQTSAGPSSDSLSQAGEKTAEKDILTVSIEEDTEKEIRTEIRNIVFPFYT